MYSRTEALDINNASICVHSRAVTTASAAEINPFDEDNYGSANFEIRYAKAIGFASSTGKFTVGLRGTYWIFYSAMINTASDADMTTRIKRNILTTVAHIDSLNDPMNRSYSTIVDCLSGDVITVTIDSNSPNIQHLAGSTLTIIKIPDYALLETTPTSLINNDFVINGFSQDHLSVQHNRSFDQVPFLLGTRGALSLRGRVSQVAVVDKGDKKN